MVRRTMWTALFDYLPRGNTLDEVDWQRRHRLISWVLLAHVPGLAVFGLLTGHPPLTVTLVLLVPAGCLVAGHLLRRYRRTAAVIVTGGLVYCSGALVGLSGGAIESHFHFFILIGFIALYQDWAPFLFNILFVVISHGVGSVWQQSLIFSHSSGQGDPWLWSLIHGVAVLAACVGMTLFWRVTEESQQEKNALALRLADAEIGRRQFTSDLLVNLARRNQSMLYRQLDIINQLEESEQDPDALAELFKLDHLATRVRRNAESLLVLSGEQPSRVWSEPVPLRDVVRAGIAETEDLDRVVFTVDERPAVTGHSVTDLTHLLAELTENAVRFSPPDTVVTIRARPDRADEGGQLLTIEDWGVGMPPADLAAANELLANPPEVDLSVSQRLGFHVVARLAHRHGISVSLTATPGSGITAAVTVPSPLIVEPVAGHGPHGNHAAPAVTVPAPRPALARTALPPTAPPPGVPEQRRAEGVGWDTAPAATMEPGDRRDQPAAAAHASEAAHPPRGPARNGHAGNGPGAFDADGVWTGWWGDGPDPSRAPGPHQPAMAGGPPQHGAAHPSSGYVPAQAGAPQDGSVWQTPERSQFGDAAISAARRAPGPAVARPADPPPPGGLRRRVPQAHLAPELRGAADAAGPVSEAPAVPVASTATMTALSRYQASRRAALEGDERPREGS